MPGKTLNTIYARETIEMFSNATITVLWGCRRGTEGGEWGRINRGGGLIIDNSKVIGFAFMC